jgi:hypothetical protein
VAGRDTVSALKQAGYPDGLWVKRPYHYEKGLCT